MTKATKRSIKWAPLLLAFALVMLAVSAWHGPLSWNYLMRALAIGLGASVLTIAYWRWKTNYPNRPTWLVLSVVLVAGGFYWSRDQTFGLGKADAFFWSLWCQFLAAVLAVFCTVVLVLRDRLVKTDPSRAEFP